MGAVCVRWVVLAVMSLQYFVVVPFDVGFHIFTAAVADSNSLCSLLLRGKCLSISCRKWRAMLVLTLLL